jgi:cytochrome c oxidase assembly protein subunit 15
MSKDAISNEVGATSTNIWLHRYAVLTACATFVLIFVGGLVTSTGSGLAVPDWPLSYGQVFPAMVGGVLYEHGHRLVASFVGLLTVILTVWVWRKEPRRWVRSLAAVALGAVILQGLLGGMTVLLGLPVAVSVFHACLAQAFLASTVVLAVVTSPYWQHVEPDRERSVSPSLGLLAGITTLAVYVQLILGATMRHLGAGLAIPDFPLAFGRLIPPISSDAILIHFLHRLGAVVVAAMVVWTVVRVYREQRNQARLMRPALALIGLLAVQITLGALTVLTRLSVLPTTAHVAGGAAVLVTSLILTLRSYRLSEIYPQIQAQKWIVRQAPAC